MTYTLNFEIKGGICLSGSINKINDLMVELFNDILNIEKVEIQNSPFSDLSTTEMRILETIGHRSRTMTEVAGEIGVTVGTLTTAINRLVKKEYVIRKRSEEDRRFVEIDLSHKGKQAYILREKFHQDMVKAMADRLADENNEVLIHSLKKLNEFFQQQYHLIQSENL